MEALGRVWCALNELEKFATTSVVYFNAYMLSMRFEKGAAFHVLYLDVLRAW